MASAITANGTLVGVLGLLSDEVLTLRAQTVSFPQRPTTPRFMPLRPGHMSDVGSRLCAYH